MLLAHIVTFGFEVLTIPRPNNLGLVSFHDYCSRFHSSIYFFDFLVKQIFGNQDIPIFSSPWSDLVTCLRVDFSNFRTKKMSRSRTWFVQQST